MTAVDPSTDTGPATDGQDPRGPEPVAEADIGLSQIFEVLKNQRRRHVLRYLEMTDGQVTLSDLAEQIAAWENDKDLQRITSSERKRVYVGLYQVHLPKMDDMGVVDFNKPRALIDKGENIDHCCSYLTPTAGGGTGRNWATYYVALAAASLIGLVAALLVEGATAVPVVDAITVGSLVAFAGVAAVHYGSQRTDRTTASRTG